MKQAFPSTQPLPCVCNDECRQAGSPSCRSWSDVEASLLKMDSLYGASFTSWLKNEENVTVTATYLQRVCNEYCFPRILAAIRWLEEGWKADSTAWLLRHITQHWGTGNRCSSDKVDIARATFVQCLMDAWPKIKCAEFVPAFLDLAYTSPTRRLVFLRTLFEKFDFKRLSELFSLMGSGLDYSSKVLLLQEAARRDCLKLTNKRRQELVVPPAPASPKRSKFSRNSNESNIGYLYPEGISSDIPSDSDMIQHLDEVMSSNSNNTDFSVVPPSSNHISSRRPSSLNISSTRLARTNTSDNFSITNHPTPNTRTDSMECSSSSASSEFVPSSSSMDTEISSPNTTGFGSSSSIQDPVRSSRTCPGSPSLSQPFLTTYTFSPASPTHGFFPEDSTSQDHSSTKVTSLF